MSFSSLDIILSNLKSDVYEVLSSQQSCIDEGPQ